MSLRPSEKRALEQKNRAEADNADASEARYGVADGRREGFVQSNIRLITFLVCLALFLVVFGPWSVFRVVDCVNSQREGVSDKQNITLDYVRGLAQKGEDLSWGDFSSFNYVDMSYEYKDEAGNKRTYFKREYYVTDESLCVWVGGASLKARPDYVYLVNTEDGGSIDIRKEKIDGFINRDGKDK